MDLDKGLIYLWKQKSGRQQTIPLTGKARGVLGERGEPDHYVFKSPACHPSKRSVRRFVEGTSKAFREARDEAKITRPISVHGLRHGFCSMLAEAGKSAIVIKEAARHADISTSMQYVHMANQRLKEELDEVFG